MLYVNRSIIYGANKGVFTKIGLPRGLIFGRYKVRYWSFLSPRPGTFLLGRVHNDHGSERYGSKRLCVGGKQYLWVNDGSTTLLIVSAGYEYKWICVCGRQRREEI